MAWPSSRGGARTESVPSRFGYKAVRDAKFLEFRKVAGSYFIYRERTYPAITVHHHFETRILEVGDGAPSGLRNVAIRSYDSSETRSILWRLFREYGLPFHVEGGDIYLDVPHSESAGFLPAPHLLRSYIGIGDGVRICLGSHFHMLMPTPPKTEVQDTRWGCTVCGHAWGNPSTVVPVCTCAEPKSGQVPAYNEDGTPKMETRWGTDAVYEAAMAAFYRRIRDDPSCSQKLTAEVRLAVPGELGRGTHTYQARSQTLAHTHSVAFYGAKDSDGERLITMTDETQKGVDTYVKTLRPEVCCLTPAQRALWDAYKEAPYFLHQTMQGTHMCDWRGSDGNLYRTRQGIGVTKWGMLHPVVKEAYRIAWVCDEEVMRTDASRAGDRLIDAHHKAQAGALAHLRAGNAFASGAEVYAWALGFLSPEERAAIWGWGELRGPLVSRHVDTEWPVVITGEKL